MIIVQGLLLLTGPRTGKRFRWALDAGSHVATRYDSEEFGENVYLAGDIVRKRIYSEFWVVGALLILILQRGHQYERGRRFGLYL